MLENIIIGVIVIGALLLAIRYFKKGKCDCCDNQCDKETKACKKKPPCCK